MVVTATQVKILREKTGAGMMECKKALVEANGKMEKSIELLRTRGEAKALKKSERIAAEGLVALAHSNDYKQAVLIELNCETDFVARQKAFIEFANKIANQALLSKAEDVEVLLEATLEGETIEEHRVGLISTLGENITLRRVAYQSTNSGMIGVYTHGGTQSAQIATMVVLDKPNNTILEKDLAMHVAAMRPIYLSREQIPVAEIEKEKAVIMAQVEKQFSNKPEAIVQKIIEGKLNKWAQEITLLGQLFVKDSDKTISDLLNEHKNSIINFTRFEVGEGIEKEHEDFAQEVMSQVHSRT